MKRSPEVTASEYTPPNVDGGGEQVQLLYPYGVGIDCHSQFVQVCVLIQRDVLRRWEREFSTAIADLEAAGEWVRSVLRKQGREADPLRYTLESTGCYHLPVIRAFGGVPSMVNPLLASPSRRKTDVLDARLLAYHALTGLWPASYLPTNEVQSLRVLMHRRRVEMKKRARCISHVNNYLLRYGHTIGAWGNVGSSDIRPLVEDLARGEIVVRHPGLREEPFPKLVAAEILSLYRLFDEADAAVKVLTKQAVEYAEFLEWPVKGGVADGRTLLKNICTVPGVGEVTAVTWLAEIGDVTRFSCVEKVAAYCGLDPSLKVSAGKVTSQSRRKGNGTLHRVLVQCGQTLVIRRSEPFGQWGYALSHRSAKGGWVRGVCAVARKVGGAVYWVHLKNEPFTYEHYRLLPQAEEVPDTPLTGVLSDRVLAALSAAGIRDARSLFVWFIEGGRRIKGFGPVAKKEVAEWLDALRKTLAEARRRESSPTGSRRTRPTKADCSSKVASSQGKSGTSKRRTTARKAT